MRLSPDPDAVSIETEEGAARWIRIVLGWLVPACDPGDASPMIWKMQAARREALKLQRRLVREGRPPTEIAAAIRALLLADGFERLVHQADASSSRIRSEA